jgi:hypothetical protein
LFCALLAKFAERQFVSGSAPRVPAGRNGSDSVGALRQQHLLVAANAPPETNPLRCAASHSRSPRSRDVLFPDNLELKRVPRSEGATLRLV